MMLVQSMSSARLFQWKLNDTFRGYRCSVGNNLTDFKPSKARYVLTDKRKELFDNFVEWDFGVRFPCDADEVFRFLLLDI